MKLYVVEGMIRCGHRVYSLQKYIIASSRSEARDTYKVEHNCATYGEYLDWKYPKIGA